MQDKKLNKLQIRAEILNSIKDLCSTQQKSDEFIASIMLPLSEIEDKETILDILIKEITAPNPNSRFFTIVFLLETLIPKEMLEKQLWQLLEEPRINDETKAKIINILRDLGNQINYDKYLDYFENPDSVIDADTKKLLVTAISNPEAQIDFLDFIEALPEDDRNMLIDSLSSDYSGDELANIFSPLVYAAPESELCKYALGRLSESKSALAIEPLQWVSENSKDNEIKSLAQKGLKMLKLAGIQTQSTDGFYNQLLSSSTPQEAYLSLPDGHGSVGVLIHRKRPQDDSVQMFAVVFNEKNGILDCFGFNQITQEEFDRIVKKFFSNQEKITAPLSLIKSILNKAEKLSIKENRRISYEYICWKNIIRDIEGIENLNEFLTQNLEKRKITAENLKKLYTTALFDNWFFETGDNEYFDKLIVKLINESSAQDNAQRIIDDAESYIMLEFSKIWSEEALSKMKERLTFMAYLLERQGHKEWADLVYSMGFDNEILTEFLINIIKSSIYQFLLREKEKYQNPLISTNIFSKRNEANNALIKKDILEALIKQAESRWGR